MKILIVDDEAFIRDGIEKRILKYGYQPSAIYKAMDAHMAERLLAQESIDIAFIDINMPFMNGLEFIEKYKSSGVYFVIVSGYDKFEYAKKAIELGVVRYLLKPIDKNEFMQVMDELIAKIKPYEKNVQYSSNMTKILDCIYKHCTDANFSLSECCDILQLSESTISKIVKKESQTNFNDLVNQQRIQHAIKLIAQSEGKVKIAELAQACGFTSQQYFSVVFKKYTQKTPTQYKPEG